MFESTVSEHLSHSFFLKIKREVCHFSLFKTNLPSACGLDEIAVDNDIEDGEIIHIDKY